jgi:hypothetical protein
MKKRSVIPFIISKSIGIIKLVYFKIESGIFANPRLKEITYNQGLESQSNTLGF